MLGDLARVAARTVTAAVRATIGEADLRVGIIGCLQTHGSLANCHPHLHLDPGAGHPAGFHVHAGVGVPEDDRAFALRVARYCVRNPVALDRLAYAAESDRVTYRSDKADRPTASSEPVDPLEFLARLVTHIPDPGQVMQRYYGWYASRTRGTRRRSGLEPSGPDGSVAIVDPADWSLRAARFRRAELLRRMFEVDPLTCPRCRGLMRLVAVITDPAVITRILAHRARALEPSQRSRSPPPRRRRSPTPTAAGPPTGSPGPLGAGAAGVAGCPGGGGAPPSDGLAGRCVDRIGPERHRPLAPGT